MAHARSTHPAQKAAAFTRTRHLFFKPDHPRAIDQYIDYFGGADGASTVAGDDVCGETVLERLA
jgi:hypothetical protein